MGDLRIGVVLVGHGQLPRDLPDELAGEYLGLKFKRPRTPAEEGRLGELEKLVLDWPRDEGNDPYYHGLHRLSEKVASLGRFERVWVAFNEFCRPKLGEALEEACRSGVDVVVVVTTMLTRGGEHSEEEIPAAIEEHRSKCGRPLIYAWPFDEALVARLLVESVRSHLSSCLAGEGYGPGGI